MNIKISKNAHVCAACETDFTHEQTLTSTVRVLEGALQRMDFCSECWGAQKNKNAYSIWNTIYYDPNVEDEQPPEVFSPLRQLFYDAAALDTRIEMATAFLAAGLLRRQKVFRRIKESDESDGEVRITLYTDRIGNRLIEVPDPQFSYAEMEEARNLLLTRLKELEKAEESVEEDTSENAESAPAGQENESERAIQVKSDDESPAVTSSEDADEFDDGEDDDDDDDYEFDDDEEEGDEFDEEDEEDDDDVESSDADADVQRATEGQLDANGDEPSLSGATSMQPDEETAHAQA